MLSFLVFGNYVYAIRFYELGWSVDTRCANWRGDIRLILRRLTFIIFIGQEILFFAEDDIAALPYYYSVTLDRV